MATIEGWRIVRRPAYSSLDPAVEGAVITAPGTSVTDPCWVWSDFRVLALFSCFNGLRGPLGDGFDHYAAKPLLTVEWDDGDVVETVAVDGGHRYLVAACEVADELTLQEAAGLAAQAPVNPGRSGYPLWHAGDAVGFVDTHGVMHAPFPGFYDAVELGGVESGSHIYPQSGRRIYAAEGTTLPATVGAEVGYMDALRYPYGYLAILAAHGR